MARPKKDALIDLSKAHELTAGLIERLTCPAGKSQAFLRDSKAPSLRVRVTAAGAKSFVFEAKLNRRTIRKTIGDVRAWSIDGPEGTHNARSEANRLRVTVDTGSDPRELERKAKEAEQVAALAKLEAGKHTLKHLLTQYCDYLEAQGRVSYKDARSVLRLHVYEAWPALASMPANEITAEQVADMMRRLIELGHGRTANILRTYVRSAYQIARQARSTPKTPLAFKAFNIHYNPAADTFPDQSANKSAKNPLPIDDMRTYWRSIKGMPGFRGALLRLHLLTGGQRIRQLVRLKRSDIRGDSITIFDGKGRPGPAPRAHRLPLLPLAAEALKECNSGGEYALSTDRGETHVSAETLSEWACDAGAGIGGFQTKRLRSGVETLLSEMNITREHKGLLQSHGISGVQAKHYDGCEYIDVKRNALVVLFNVLEAPDATNVVPLRADAA